MPLVGEGGLSEAIRPCREGIERPATFSASGVEECSMPLAPGVGKESSGIGVLRIALSRTEPNRAGVVALLWFAGGLAGPSDPLEEFRLRPGNCRFCSVSSSAESSSRLRLYAADPIPRSAVCLKKAGSFEPRAWAMSCLVGSSLELGLSLGDATGEVRVELFSCASNESGRFLMPDCGRLCQDMVFAREGMAALGDAFEGLPGLSIDVVVSWPSGLMARLRASSRTGSRRGDEDMLSDRGGVPLTGVLVPIERGDWDVFSGERERSRSTMKEWSAISWHKSRMKQLTHASF